MSADNYMAVKKIDEMWHVWMVLGGYSEEDWNTPSGHWHRKFNSELFAHHYAHKVCNEELVEYGVVFLGDEMCDEKYCQEADAHWRDEMFDRPYSGTTKAQWRDKAHALRRQRDEARRRLRLADTAMIWQLERNKEIAKHCNEALDERDEARREAKKWHDKYQHKYAQMLGERELVEIWKEQTAKARRIAGVLYKAIKKIGKTRNNNKYFEMMCDIWDEAKRELPWL